ncbi:hypothetical protein N7582_004735 [Saccharomyces uvarum]|uniref:Uncharacterized protein n=1 Tax=Saccharomyces uvarum TaxID=230603 RepID=A0AA35NLD2_SACUV|nr:hypothetical protein N7582_004735 [Saccharomyces uvarum]CAI4049714.1 hypothetical protein SUVC_14G0800 [Saccharomyces uvarum]
MQQDDDFQTFVATLESFKDLKSGISGSRIKKLTTYALDHIDIESKIISLIIDYSRLCPDSHKLGSLYIIDSIGRAYLDETRSTNTTGANNKSGTCTHAINTLGEVIQELLSDAIAKSNQDHKEKIRMLLDIWDRSGLFQKSYLNAIRSKCFAMDITNNTAAPPQQLSSDPRQRSKQILSNLKATPPLNLPINVPTSLTSADPAKQQTALFQLIAALQQHFNPSSSSSSAPTAVVPPSQTHTITEYGSRRERERERERYSSRRNRSRSPPPPLPQPSAARKDRYPSVAQDQYSIGAPNTTFGTNNHHLYPDELNVSNNPHYRPKPVSYDSTLPPDHIKVYSRTLFIGGVPQNMKEWDLANVLRPFAEVQSVILNNSRKHAFVKVYSRHEAENVLQHFNKDGALPLRTRWGVGFGPRDCCDYQHGYSIIPMHRLTDADKKWSVSAQWGGTSGQPLVTGIVFEEPDIIVGEGVSSKAISQKMPTDSGRNGPRSGKPNKSGSISSLSPVPYGNASLASPPPQQYAQPIMQQPYGYPPTQPLPPQGPPAAAVPVPQQQQFDPTAQLNSLMNMLNQQQQQQQQS